MHSVVRSHKKPLENLTKTDGAIRAVDHVSLTVTAEAAVAVVVVVVVIDPPAKTR